MKTEYTYVSDIAKRIRSKSERKRMAMNKEIRERLFELQDDKYRIFSSSLIPGEEKLLGVRLPFLRKIAKEIAKGDVRGFLEDSPVDYFEELMLRGMVIAYADCTTEEKLEWIESFIPLINNWSICDSFCVGISTKGENHQKIWSLMERHLTDEKEFGVRFSVVMLLHYVNEVDINQVFAALSQVTHEGYYAKMSVAWVLSVCYVSFPEKTEDYLCNANLDAFTFHKTIQKIMESKRVKPESKEKLRQLKLKFSR